MVWGRMTFEMEINLPNPGLMTFRNIHLAQNNKLERKRNSPNLDGIHLSLSVVGRGDPSATINSSWNGNENGFNSAAADPQTHKLRSSSSDRPTS